MIENNKQYKITKKALDNFCASRDKLVNDRALLNIQIDATQSEIETLMQEITDYLSRTGQIKPL